MEKTKSDWIDKSLKLIILIAVCALFVWAMVGAWGFALNQYLRYIVTI